MIAEQTTAPASDNSDASVRARFNESVSQLTPEQRGGIILPETKPVIKTEEKTPEAEATKTDEVPDEFFSETKPTVDEWDKITNEDHKGHVTNDHWKNYKKLTKSKVEALTRELEEVRKKIPGDDYLPEKTAKELEALRTQLKEREELISRKYIQETPQFTERFSKKESAIENQIHKVAKVAGIDEDQIQAVLHASETRRFNLLGEIENEGARASIASLLNNRDMLFEEKASFLAEHEKNLSQYQEQTKAQEDAEKAKVKKLYDTAFDQVLQKMQSEYGPLKKIEGKDDWNKAIEEDIALAKSMFHGEDFTPHRDAEAFIQAATAKRLSKMLDKAVGRARAAEKELAELKAAGPTASQAQDGKGGDPTKDMSPNERAAWTFNQAKATAVNNGNVRR